MVRSIMEENPQENVNIKIASLVAKEFVQQRSMPGKDLRHVNAATLYEVLLLRGLLDVSNNVIERDEDP